MIKDAFSWFAGWIVRQGDSAKSAFLTQVDAMIPPVPGVLSGVCGQISGALGWMPGWVPWGSVALAVGFWLIGLVAGLSIKITRIVLSFLTLGGGSAA